MASTNTTLSAIRGGIATLANGTCWHISSSELLKAKNWRVGAEVADTGPEANERRNGGATERRPHPTLRRALTKRAQVETA